MSLGGVTTFNIISNIYGYHFANCVLNSWLKNQIMLHNGFICCCSLNKTGIRLKFGGGGGGWGRLNQKQISDELCVSTNLRRFICLFERLLHVPVNSYGHFI